MRKSEKTLYVYVWMLLVLLGANGTAVQAQDQGSYQLKINIEYLRNPGNGSCLTNFRIYQNKGGNEQTLQDWSAGHVDKGEVITVRPVTEKIYTTQPDTKPDYIGFYGIRGWRNVWGKCRVGIEGGDGYRIDYNRAYIDALFSQGDNGNALFKGYETTVRLRMHPYAIKLFYFDANGQLGTSNQNNLLPATDAITLKASKGFSAATYEWQYSTDQVSWSNFPNTVQYRDNKSEVTFQGTDLLPEDQFRALVGNQNLFVRIKAVTEVSAQAIVLYPCLSAPHFSAASYEPESCFGTGDAIVQLTFDRPLIPGEVMYIKRNNQLNQGDLPVVLDAFNTVRFSGIEAGSYNFSLLKSFNGQLSYVGDPTHTTTLTVANRPAVTHGVDAITQVNCFDGTDGAVTVHASGGNGSFVGTLFESGGQQAIQTIQFTATGKGLFSRLKAGTYRIEIFDTNRCSAYDTQGNLLTHTVTIQQPQQPVDVTLTQTVAPLAFASSDGQATIRVSGGTETGSGYTIVWRSEQGESFQPHTSSRDGADLLYTFKGLHRGNYYITVTDNRYPSLLPVDQTIPCGCSDTLSFFLAAPPLLEVTIEQSHQVNCKGSNDGVLTARATGGVPLSTAHPYRYTWYRYEGGAPQELSLPDDLVARNLIAGTYQVKITDANRITAQSIPFLLTEPDSLSIRLQANQIGCSGAQSGKVEAVVTGGTPPYRYQWNREGETQSEITALEAGIYMLKVTDSNNCLLVATTEVKGPGALQIDTLITHPSCLAPTGGTIQLTLSGATAPYTVRWADTPSTELVRRGLPHGVYYAAVTDANGCSASYSFTLQKPREFQVTLNEDFTMCRGESRTIQATSGEPDLTYAWYWNESKLPDTGREITIDKAGLYRVEATNAQGCRAEDEIEVRVGQEPLPLDFTVPTVIAVNAEIHAVNISTVTADQIHWRFPPGAVISKQTDTEAIFTIPQKGRYTLTMEGVKGECNTLVTRTIEVLNKGEVELPDNKEPLIKQFLVTPNPTTGYFKVLVELSRPENFSLLLYAPSGFLMDRKEQVQTQNNLFEYEINGSVLGTYLLHLQTTAGKSVLPIVIVRQ